MEVGAGAQPVMEYVGISGAGRKAAILIILRDSER